MSVKSAILEATIALQHLKCSEVNWGEVEMRVANIRAELAKPDLLMACPECHFVGTPYLHRSYFEYDQFLPSCKNRKSRIPGHLAREKYEYIYKEQE